MFSFSVGFFHALFGVFFFYFTLEKKHSKQGMKKTHTKKGKGHKNKGNGLLGRAFLAQ